MFSQELLYLKVLLNRRKKLKRHIYNSARRLRANKRRMLLLAAVWRRYSGRKRRKIWTIARNKKFWEEDVPLQDNKQFKENFRMTRSLFKELSERLKSLRREDTGMRDAIPLEKRVAIALYALGSSAEYRTVSNVFGVGRTTVGEIVREVCEEICEKMEKEFIAGYPPTQQKIEENVAGFAALGFPQCYGAIDACHIAVNVPKEDATDYYNYKGWHSVVLLAIADYRCRFTYINVGSPGRNNDSYIFESSLLKNTHITNLLFQNNSRSISGENVPVLLIADSAFGLSPFLMKPYPTSTNRAERDFNYHLSKCRRVIENAFDHLKARFKKIGRGLKVNINNTALIIRACCILHNFCAKYNDEIWSSWTEEAILNRKDQPTFNTSVGETNTIATKIRDAIAQYVSLTDDAALDTDANPSIARDDACAEEDVEQLIAGSSETRCII